MKRMYHKKKMYDKKTRRRKSPAAEAPEQGALVCDVFVPSKVPLSNTWFANVPPERQGNLKP